MHVDNTNSKETLFSYRIWHGKPNSFVSQNHNCLVTENQKGIRRMYSTEAYNKVKLSSTLYIHKRKEKNNHCHNSILLKLGQTSYQMCTLLLSP